MSTKRYKLLKDLPDAKAGEIYSKRSEYSDRYCNEDAWNGKSPVIEANSYFSWQVENNPEWFSLIEGEEKKEFQWTDELVLEFARFTNQLSPTMQGRYADLDQFKSSLQLRKEIKKTLAGALKIQEQPEERLRWRDRKKAGEKDWRIIRWRTKDGGYYTDWMSAHGVKDLTIESVKRLSDNITFSIGDEVKWAHHEPFAITKFKEAFGSNAMLVEKEGGLSFDLNRLQKISSQPQPTKERTEVTFLSEFARFGKNYHYEFWSTKPIPPNQFELLKKTIEGVLNSSGGVWFTADEDLNIKFYTQKQVDEIEEAAWDAAREDIDCGGYATFQDYKKSKA